MQVTRAIFAAAVLGWAGLAAAAPPGSLTLNEAYRMALAQSEQVQEALANRRIADATYTDALTVMGPNIRVYAQSVFQNGAAVASALPGQAASGQQPPYNAAVIANITQPLFRRQIWDQRRATHFGIDAADATVARARQQLMFDVATAFIGVMQARQQYVIGKDAVKRAEIELQDAAKKVKLGTDYPAAEQLASIDVHRAELQLNTAEGQVRLVESQLQRLIGVPVPENLLLPPTPKVEKLSDAIDDSRMRPDLRSLRAATQQALATVSQLQDKLFWPTLDVSFNGGYILYGNFLPAKGYTSYPTYGVGGIFTVPLFQSGDEFLQIRMQRNRASFAAAAESFSWRQIQDDVREASSRYEIAQHGIEIANEQEKSAKKNFELTLNRYKLADGTLLELVTAQAAIFEAETNRVVAYYAQELAAYQLLFAAGKIDL